MMSANSTRPVRKAVVPAAGLGTRHFPASHAVKKELFPIVGPDGIARALIHYHLLELAAAGIEQICIIVQSGEDKLIRSYLDGPDAAYLKRLEKHPALLAEVQRMRDLSERVCFAVQHQQEGYGHAVYQTKSFAGDEMVLLCLGDHLFRSRPVSPYRRLAEMSAMSGGKSVSAVNRIGPDELKGFGTIAGKRRIGTPELIDVSLIIEKPSAALARQKLRVDGLGPDEFLGWFGMHLLSPSIYEILEEMIRNDLRDGGEFQLTRAQELQRQREGYLAVEMTEARRFDFGTPNDLVRSIQAFSLPS
ncbi:MAG TPA: sugar phosphate nucleotidyltransferase [Tepidisphaeraceae bacterium]|jgi:UTP--glucose-1-phosphate uridylyltransferase|nr:sugar phosphate nucleotidyltransferase [Tepidisphaeraceae bacterium]